MLYQLAKAAKTAKFTLIGFLVLFTSSVYAFEASQLAGTYQVILNHEETHFYQHGVLTLRTANPNGNLQISANLRVYFGPADSNEFLTYDFSPGEVQFYVLTRQLTLLSPQNDVSMIGYLREGEFQGDWYSTLRGKVGLFSAKRNAPPAIPDHATLVTSLSGYYRGTLMNTNPLSNLPEQVTLSFVTTQDNSNPARPTLHISGNARFYFNSFESHEYEEIVFNDIQFNFYNRFLTAKTDRLGFTFVGTMSHDGKFKGMLYSDGLAEVGEVNLERYVYRPHR